MGIAMTVIGSWNLENLFRPGGAFGPKDEAAYRAKLRGLAATVRSVGADVLAVQEVGDPAALADLVAELGDGWSAVTSTVFEARHPIRVGVLSRLPVRIVKEAAAFPAGLAPVQVGDAGPTVTSTTAMGRGALAAEITEASGGKLTLVSVHLKSKLLSFPPGPDGRPRFSPRDEGERARIAAYALGRRAAEAVTIRALADQLLEGKGKERPLIVAGDFNDGPESATTQIFYGPPGSELGTPGAAQPDKGDVSRLWNLSPRLPEGERFSRVYQGRGELIDHLLVSHALLARATEVHTAHPGVLPSIADDPTVRRDAPASDHALIYVRLA
ncbi:endonuclease/exonuclease/phosphatase family protein [Actinocorallia longicatena]|uniref:Endonuclease/exonuclease/phosphatase domain-containing protein n=1 Tax=Actinocorallia longicatena TaxID=111803 RepID=A0ABP6QN66_9ACTN